MIITIFSIGKKNEPWVEQGIDRFLKRLRAPFAADLVLIPSSGSTDSATSREEESDRLLSRLRADDFVILLDERGDNISSPELSSIIQNNTSQKIVFVIGGAYGVDETLRDRANIVWSLSRLVFPHQLVRLILAEQLYRAQEIARGGQYHHD